MSAAVSSWAESRALRPGTWGDAALSLRPPGGSSGVVSLVVHSSSAMARLVHGIVKRGIVMREACFEMPLDDLLTTLFVATLTASRFALTHKAPIRNQRSFR